ncbi:MAG: c-type cytochrome [Deltaproteobacteria bacterium]|nr:MAG: c-type cytochrome [Deltaproteobacteria bacterium]
MSEAKIRISQVIRQGPYFVISFLIFFLVNLLLFFTFLSEEEALNRRIAVSNTRYKGIKDSLFSKLYKEGAELWSINCKSCHGKLYSGPNVANTKCFYVDNYFSPLERMSFSCFLHGKGLSDAFYNLLIKQEPFISFDFQDRSSNFILKSICLGCHTIGAEGGRGAPPLDNLKDRYTRESLTEWLKHPQKIVSKTLMPNIPMTDSELKEIVNRLLPEKEIGNSDMVFRNKCTSCHYISSFNPIEEVNVSKKNLFHLFKGKTHEELTHYLVNHIKQLNKENNPELRFTFNEVSDLSKELLMKAPPAILYESCLACHSFRGEGNGLYALEAAYMPFGMKYQDSVNMKFHDKRIDSLDLIKKIKNIESISSLNKRKSTYLNHLIHSLNGDETIGILQNSDRKHIFLEKSYQLLLDKRNHVQEEIRDIDHHAKKTYLINLSTRYDDSQKKRLVKRFYNAWKEQSLKDFLEDPILYDAKKQIRYVAANIPLEMPKPHMDQDEMNQLVKFLSEAGEHSSAFMEKLERGRCLTCHTENDFLGGTLNKKERSIISSDNINPFPVRYQNSDGKYGIDFVDPSFDLQSHIVQKRIAVEAQETQDLKKFLLNINSKAIEISKAFLENGCIICHPFFFSDLTMQQRALKNNINLKELKSEVIFKSTFSLMNIERFIDQHYKEYKKYLNKELVGCDVKDMDNDTVHKIRNFLGKINEGAKVAPVVYSSKMCSACHRIDNKGGVIGPDLSHIGKERSSEYLKVWLRNPWNVKRNTRMPHINLTENEIQDLVVFLSSLK